VKWSTAQLRRESRADKVLVLTGIEGASHAIVGQCAEARRDVSSGLELGRDNGPLERASRVLALCGAGCDALSLSSEVAKRFPDATLTNRVSLPVTASAVAIEQGEPARGLALLEPVRGYDHARRRSSGPPTYEARHTFS
jgi:hypothetical protein